jgi:hypothetical protein
MKGLPGQARPPQFAIAGFIPATHGAVRRLPEEAAEWVAGTSPAMTEEGRCAPRRKQEAGRDLVEGGLTNI